MHPIGRSAWNWVERNMAIYDENLDMCGFDISKLIGAFQGEVVNIAYIGDGCISVEIIDRITGISFFLIFYLNDLKEITWEWQDKDFMTDIWDDEIRRQFQEYVEDNYSTYEDLGELGRDALIKGRWFLYNDDTKEYSLNNEKLR